MRINIISNLVWVDRGYNVSQTVSWLKYEFLVIFVSKCVQSCEGMTSPTHSFEYSEGLYKKCFLKKQEISKFHIFLISYPILIIFAPYCRENVSLSFKNMLFLFRISSLSSFKPLWHGVNSTLILE